MYKVTCNKEVVKEGNTYEDVVGYYIKHSHSKDAWVIYDGDEKVTYNGKACNEFIELRKKNGKYNT